MTKIDATHFMTAILGMWTEPAVDARRAVIQAHFDEGVYFHDPDGEFVGHAGLEAFSDSLQQRFPGARFTLADTPRTVGNAICAFWHFGPPENPQAVRAWTSSSLTAERRAISTLSSTTRVAAASGRAD